MPPLRYWLVKGFDPPFKIYTWLPDPPTVDQIYEVAPPNHVDQPSGPPSVVEMTKEEFYSPEYDLTLRTVFL